MRSPFPILAAALGLGLAANGLIMLIEPANWYFAVPGATTTGPFNQHFLRDIGPIFVLIGAAFVGGAIRPSERSVLWGCIPFAYGIDAGPCAARLLPGERGGAEMAGIFDPVDHEDGRLTA